MFASNNFSLGDNEPEVKSSLRAKQTPKSLTISLLYEERSHAEMRSTETPRKTEYYSRQRPLVMDPPRVRFLMDHMHQIHE